MASSGSDFVLTGKSPLNVVIVGGSLTGLMNGLMIKQLGHNVRILEQNAFSERTDHAAGMGTGPQGLEFIQTHDRIEEKYSYSCPGIKFLLGDVEDKNLRSMPLNLTSWDVLYYRFRANFDGYASSYYPNPPEAVESDGDSSFELGKRVENVTYEDGQVTVEYDDLINGGSGSCTADLVIVADGANSTIRRKLRPDVKRGYAGYVAWRGTVPETEVEEDTVKLWGDTSNAFFGKGQSGKEGYLVGYVIPGQNGSLEPGMRLYNWVWYYFLPGNTQTYNEVMTDTDNKVHRTTLPIGKMRPEIWSRQLEIAKTKLKPPASFLELMEKTTKPFISTIGDQSCPQAAFLNKRVLLLGEALNLLRPHTGMSFGQSAMHTLALERVLKGEKGYGIREWEREVLQWGERTKWMTIVFGRYYLSGWFGIHLFAAYVRWYWVLAKQRVIGMWWKLCGFFGR